MLKILCNVSVFILMSTMHIIMLSALILYSFTLIKYFKDMFMSEKIYMMFLCLVVLACNILLAIYSASLIHR